MKNLKITLAALLLSFSFNFATAQSIGEKATTLTESMNTQLGLSANQKAKVEELNFAIMSKNEAIKNNQNMSEDLKKQSIQGNNEGRLQQLNEILTPEQFTKYKQSQIKTDDMKYIKGKTTTQKITIAE